jgi:acetyl esterase/lipase
MQKKRRIILASIMLFLIAGLIAILTGWKKREDYNNQQKKAILNTLSQMKYPYSQVMKQRFGEGMLAYWLYQPQGAPSSALPVVLFLHGWMGFHPFLYGGWIDHLAKSGYIVIFPVFQTSKQDTPDQMLQSAIHAIQDAIRQLNQAHANRPDWNRFAIVGHSFGGGMSVRIAALAKDVNIPIPKLVMPVAPGWLGSDTMPTDTLSRIAPSVQMYIVEGADDTLKSSRKGRAIYAATPQIPVEHKNFIILASNNPNIKVDHNAPTSPLDSYQDSNLSERERRRQRFATWLFNRFFRIADGEINAIDVHGYWLLFDQLCETAFIGNKSAERSLKSVSQNFAQSSGAGTPDDPAVFVIPC